MRLSVALALLSVLSLPAVSADLTLRGSYEQAVSEINGYEQADRKLKKGKKGEKKTKKVAKNVKSTNLEKKVREDNEGGNNKANQNKAGNANGGGGCGPNPSTGKHVDFGSIAGLNPVFQSYPKEYLCDSSAECQSCCCYPLSGMGYNLNGQFQKTNGVCADYGTTCLKNDVPGI